MGRTPTACNRFTSQNGDGLICTSLIKRPEYLAHLTEFFISTLMDFSTGSMRGAENLTTGLVNFAPVNAASTRAMPMTLIQSGRLGVIKISNTVSASPIKSSIFIPSGVFSGRTIRPSARSESPNSTSEHNIPSLGTPLTARASIFNPPVTVAPTSARGASIPAATFGAPQTICNCLAPVLTIQTDNLSAFGCLATDSTLATTILEKSLVSV